jgi:hypothetical protein
MTLLDGNRSTPLIGFAPRSGYSFALEVPYMDVFLIGKYSMPERAALSKHKLGAPECCGGGVSG